MNRAFVTGVLSISLLSCSSTRAPDELPIAELPINEQPMYGGKHSPTVEENLEFSQRAAELGWECYYRGDLDTAIKRFNQAWMFDRDSADALWGLGLVMGQRAAQTEPEQNLEESIRFLEMACESAPEDGRILGDLAHSITILGFYCEAEKGSAKEAEQYFSRAGSLYSRAHEASPEYPPILANWSVFCFYAGDYEEAQTKADAAVRMGYRFPPDYSRELAARLAEQRTR